MGETAGAARDIHGYPAHEQEHDQLNSQQRRVRKQSRVPVSMAGSQLTEKNATRNYPATRRNNSRVRKPNTLPCHEEDSTPAFGSLTAALLSGFMVIDGEQPLSLVLGRRG